MKNLLALVLACSLVGTAVADEGMWLFNAPPRERVQRDYGFELTDAWLGRVMRAAVRFNNGGSGSFVSPEGLVITNHHIGSDALQKLSSKGRDLVQEGYLATSRDQELPCVDLELNVLESIEDVTARVEDAVKPEMSDQDAAAARRAVMATIEKESLDKTGLRSDIITLYQGGAYHLYRFKQYTDVRLVMAPEHPIAFFGGDAHNFEYPRYNLDICFFRVYENGQPARTPDYLPWSAAGPKDGELVFVVGNPGRTNRLETFERLEHMRDLSLPYRLARLRHAEANLIQYGQLGPEQARQAQGELYSVANARKAYSGQLQGLLNNSILAAKKAGQDKLAARLEAAGDSAAAQAFGEIARAQARLTPLEREWALFEQMHALDSDLFHKARTLVRRAAEKELASELRLREYRDSNLESLELELFSPAPIEPELEKVRLADSLMFAAEVLGGAHPTLRLALGDQSPEGAAARLVEGTKLADPAERKRLAQLDLAALGRVEDSMIRLAFALDPRARELRKQVDEQVDEPERKAYAAIARGMFALDGPTMAPDATFSLRIAYGRVGGYQVESQKIPWHTTFGEVFQLAAEHHNQEPFRLPERWLAGKSRLDLSTPFNFVSTADTIGGNSGSPVIDRSGAFVGINFDRNRFGLVRNFVYTDLQARHVSVDSRAIVEVLDKLYNAKQLLAELRGR